MVKYFGIGAEGGNKTRYGRRLELLSVGDHQQAKGCSIFGAVIEKKGRPLMRFQIIKSAGYEDQRASDVIHCRFCFTLFAQKSQV